MKILKTVRRQNPVSTGKPKKDRWRKLDALAGALMVAVMFVSFGAYARFTMPSLVFGIIFLLMQRYLHANWQLISCRLVSGLLRGCAVLWLIFLIPTVFGFGSDKPQFYGVRKYLYVEGNYSDSRVLDFMPERIPECTNYSATFGAPMVGQDAQGWVIISFTTDSEGLEYIRSQAESRGGTYYRYPDGEESDRTADELAEMLDRYSKFLIVPDKSCLDVTEFCIFPETSSRHKSCYLIDAETGQVMIHW